MVYKIDEKFTKKRMIEMRRELANVLKYVFASKNYIKMNVRHCLSILESKLAWMLLFVLSMFQKQPKQN